MAIDREIPPPLPDLRLTPEDKAIIEAMDAHLAAAERELKKAEECEFDVAQLRADYEKLKRQREKILRVYG